MAVGLASVFIAVLVNDLATLLFHKSFLFWPLAIISLIIGHTFNIALGILSPSLHSIRLHYVEFFSKFYGNGVEVRFRPGYFPFVEPGVEVDMFYRSTRGEQWLELMGAGMVHPNVLQSAGIDPKKYQGFAFGVGIERLIAIKYGIEDVRLFHNGDLRFVSQF